MTTVLYPKLEILPKPQLKLWPELRNAASLGFVLYGGTAIALHLGHRDSIDFDFFNDQPLNKTAMLRGFPFLQKSRNIQETPDTLTYLVPIAVDGPMVKVSLFGEIDFGRVGIPSVTSDGILEVASLDDLMATKVQTILQRVEVKDYRDIAAMINAGVSLSKGLSSARLMFGTQFQPSESLKTLTYFKGLQGEPPLTDNEQVLLIKAVQSVRALPEAALLSKSLVANTKAHAPTSSSEFQARIRNLKNLEGTFGPAKTFWNNASSAIAQGDVDAVDWEGVELDTIIESISHHDQSPSDVIKAICTHSPGSISHERQKEIRLLIGQQAAGLQAIFRRNNPGQDPNP